MKQSTNYVKEINRALEQYEDDFIFGPPLVELKERIEAIEHSIAVVGQFSVGKSALLNALLGEEVLAARRIEATKVLTKIKTVKREEDKRVNLHFTSGEVKTIQIQDVGELDQYTTFQGDKVTDELTLVELYWPVSFLNDELTLVDTPGANSITEGAFQVTEEALEEAAAIIYLFNGQKGMDQTDYDLLKGYTDRQKRVFIVATHVDGLTPAEWEQVAAHVTEHLDGYVPKEEQTLYPVSSVLALQGKLESNEEALHASQIDALERALQQFMEDASYKEAGLRSIGHDFETIMEEIAMEEASEEERERLAEEQRQKRYDRLVAITRANYGEVEQYGLKLLNRREDGIQETQLPGKNELKQFERTYQKKFRQSFHNFVKEAEHLLDAPQTLRVKYDENEERFNTYYKEWERDIQSLHERIATDLQKEIKKEDTHFIHLMDQMKGDVDIDWQRFEKELQQLTATSESIQFDREEVDNLFEVYEAFEKEVTEEIEQHEREKKQLDEQITKMETKKKKEEIDYEYNVKSLGRAPKVETRKGERGFWIFKKTYTYEDDSKLREWEEEQAALKQKFEKKIDRLHEDLEEIVDEQERVADVIEVRKDELEFEQEAQQAELYDMLLSSLSEESSHAAERAKEYAEGVLSTWEQQMEQYQNYEMKHIRKTKRLLRTFIKAAEEQEIKKIRVI